MDLNEQFNLELKEDSNFLHSGNVEEGLSSKEQLQMLDHLNSVFAPLTATSTVNPYYMVQRIKDRIKMALGLTFDETLFLGENGNKECYLYPTELVHVKNKAGIPFPDHPYLKLFPSGLLIKFQFLKIGNIYHIDATITPAKQMAVSMAEFKD